MLKGRELDKAVAEHVMGWRRITWSEAWVDVHNNWQMDYVGTRGGVRRMIPLYSYHADAIEELVNHVRQMGDIGYEFYLGWRIGDDRQSWAQFIERIEPRPGPYEGTIVNHGRICMSPSTGKFTIKEAICYAALEVVNYNYNADVAK